MKCYKVVLRNNETEELQSCLGGWVPAIWRVTYTPSKWAKAPRDSGLFVFTDLEEARGFADPHRSSVSTSPSDIELWECECRDPMSVPKIIPQPSAYRHYTEKLFQKFWKDKSYSLEVDCTRSTPKATGFFKQVKLTKQIPIREDMNPIDLLKSMCPNGIPKGALSKLT